MAGQIGCLTIVDLLFLVNVACGFICQHHCAVLVPPLSWWWFVAVQIGHLDFLLVPIVVVRDLFASSVVLCWLLSAVSGWFEIWLFWS